MASASIHILLIAAAFLELGHERDGFVGRAHAEGRDDIDERRFDILGHALGIAADIDVGAVGEPGPQIAADVKHMAKDVETALVDVVASFGARPVNEAVAFVADLKKSGRY